MNPCISHRSISVYGVISKHIRSSWIIHLRSKICLSIMDIIWSLINSKVIWVYSWEGGLGKHVSVWIVYVFYENRIIIILCLWCWIPSISSMGIRGQVISSNFTVELCDIVWKSVVFSTKWIFEIICWYE